MSNLTRMNWKRPASRVGLLACLCGLFVGCGQQASQDPDCFVIATVVKVDGIAWFEKMREGVQKFAKDTGHDAFLLGPARADAAEQIQIIEGLIAQQVDAICVVPFSVEALEPLLKKARERGIVVVSHEASSQVNADVIIEAFDNASYGRHLMDRLAATMNEEGEYVTFVGSLTSKSHTEWMNAAVAHQKAKYPRMKLVADKIEDNEDQNQAYQKTKQLLTTYPYLKGILGSSMVTAPGAALAVEEQDLQGSVNVVGTSLVSVAGQYLQSGAAKHISFWKPEDAGYVMCKIAERLLEGGEITDGADMGVEGYRHLTQSPDKANLFQGAAWVDVTKENLTQWSE